MTSLAETTRWSAILTVVVQTPRTPDALRKNPLGLFINAIDWARELDGQPSNQARQAGRAQAPTDNLPATDDATLPTEPTAIPMPTVAPAPVPTTDEKGDRP